MKVPAEFTDELFEHIHGSSILEGLNKIIEEHGHHAIHLLKEQYGDEITDKIFNFLDLDNDGSITDTVPDIIEAAFHTLSKILNSGN